MEDIAARNLRSTEMIDEFRVLPHRDVLDCTMYSLASGLPIGDYVYEHVPCGMNLKRVDVVEANWCPHCVVYINKAALRRGRRAA